MSTGTLLPQTKTLKETTATINNNVLRLRQTIDSRGARWERRRGRRRRLQKQQHQAAWRGHVSCIWDGLAADGNELCECPAAQAGGSPSLAFGLPHPCATGRGLKSILSALAPFVCWGPMGYDEDRRCVPHSTGPPSSRDFCDPHLSDMIRKEPSWAAPRSRCCKLVAQPEHFLPVLRPGIKVAWRCTTLSLPAQHVA